VNDSGPLFDVIRIEIDEPHREDVLYTGETKADADALIKFAIIRRGVETHFFVARPAIAKAAGQ